jgi:hypothetical protein
MRNKIRPWLPEINRTKIIAGFAVFVIALIPVSRQAIKAATPNPVEYLRFE